LLFDVAALLITSAALGPAAEVSVAPAHSISQLASEHVVSAGSSVHEAVEASARSTAAFALPPLSSSDVGLLGLNGYGTLIDPSASNRSFSIATFEVARASPVELRALSGVTLLRQLSVLPRDEVSSFVQANPKSIEALLSSPPAAVEVTSLWASLTAAQQADLAASAPQLVGNLDGVPAAIRNTANRSWMKQSIASLKQGMADVPGRAVAEDAQHQLHMLSEVRDALKSTKSAPDRSLLSVDPRGAGKAAIVLGNLATADYVTYMVPGMFFTVDGQIDDWTADAQHLYKQQVAWLKLLSKNDPSLASKTVAVVAWMGYQTPDLTNIGSLDLAYQGRDALARAVEGMQSERSANEPYTTIVAHSYGSTAALMALTEYDFKVDALVLVGSPGSAAQSVKELHVRSGNVWVGAAAWDPVPNSAWFGSDPSSSSYGAHAMSVGGGVDVITGKVLTQSFGHNEYFGAHSESVRNMALIGIGHGELVSTGTAADKNRTLALEN
jgi:pimeloyl-ACP methyl ester carboxylesterase